MKKRGENKKGLSTIVATLIIILLVLVAVGIIWVVIRNVIQEGTEQVSLGKFTLDLELKQVQTISNNTLAVTVKRNAGIGEFVSLVFIIDDGVNTETVTVNATLQELEQRTFSINLQNILSGNIKKISLAPVFRLTSGKEVIGDVKDTLNVGSGISQCSSTCASLGYECGTNTICGQSVDCGTCSGGYVCSAGHCIDQSACNDTCASLGYECGTHTICGVDTNCGDVGTACSFPNAQPTCNAGQCEILSCNSNYGNCDGNEVNGCEADLTTNATCGSCLVSCDTEALETCSGGTCVAPPVSQTCGNNVQEGTEECDGTDLAGEDCASQMGAGYTGNLDCYASGTANECTFDTSGCIPPSNCGDSTCDTGECSTCAQDCTHSDCCPDGSCNNGELCGDDDVDPYCNSDCGDCAPIGIITVSSSGMNSDSLLGIPRRKLLISEPNRIWIFHAGSDPDAHYSDDGGATWTGIHFYPVGDHDAFWIGDNGVIHTAQRSTGRTFYKRISSPASQASDYNSGFDYTFTFPGGSVITAAAVITHNDDVWFFSRGDDVATQYYDRSTDAGMTWSDSGVLASGLSQNRIGGIIIDNIPYAIVWNNSAVVDDQIFFYSWDGNDFVRDSSMDLTLETTNSLSRVFSVTQTTDGRVHVAYYDNSAGERVRHVYKTRADSSWSTPVTIDDNCGSSCLVSVTSHGTDVYAAYLRIDNGFSATTYKKFDGTTNIWGSRVVVDNTGNTVSPTLPQQVSASSSYVPLAWTRGTGLYYYAIPT